MQTSRISRASQVCLAALIFFSSCGTIGKTTRIVDDVDARWDGLKATADSVTAQLDRAAPKVAALLDVVEAAESRAASRVVELEAFEAKMRADGITRTGAGAIGDVVKNPQLWHYLGTPDFWLVVLLAFGGGGVTVKTWLSKFSKKKKEEDATPRNDAS